ncbi:hypothetical protein [Pontibacter vulgaris]|uniref:hypothetical protein n=1 Tax=Pontibacter vulgaris TaxID=2905679 RepID=UPI001FA6FFD1|nr:hypothetical protein [Pontibacter vulgaris]
MADTNLLMIPLGSGDLKSVFIMDVSKVYYLSYKPETAQQTAKLTLDFGVSQKMFEKQEAVQLYEELMKYLPLKSIDVKSS